MAAASEAAMDSDEVLRAEDIAPSAFAAEDASLAAELATLGVRRPDDLEYDAANLTAWDSHPVDKSKLRKAMREKYLARRARDSVQLLLHKVFALPYEPTADGPMAVLPRARIILPRRLPVPAARAETKWEAFAKEKGIKKQKRSRMVYDEPTGEWKPRWGYQVSILCAC
jgi:regulator of ribosome biosynthesis